MDDIIDDSNEILFTVKFLGRVEVVRPSGVQILEEAAQNLKTPDKYSSEKASKKSKVHLYLSSNTLDILEHKTKFLLYSCPLTTVSFCAVLSSSPKVFGFVAQHLATDTFHCYLFQSRKFAHVLVSVIGGSFQTSPKEESSRGGRDLIVEALRHKVENVLVRMNAVKSATT
uniref:PID domain-containing protein n=1 Tax=Nothobranchius furzeri TaxID=105023 RepID=A0A8C6Q5N9_NOTFU